MPVFGPDDHIVALVPRREVRLYETAPNARLVRARRSGQVVRINLRTLSDDTSMVVHRGNPRRYSHDHEAPDNPENVWTLRRLANPDSSIDLFIRKIYRASVLDNLKAA